jgi:hypothetical protein
MENSCLVLPLIKAHSIIADVQTGTMVASAGNGIESTWLSRPNAKEKLRTTATTYFVDLKKLFEKFTTSAPSKMSPVPRKT